MNHAAPLRTVARAPWALPALVALCAFTLHLRNTAAEQPAYAPATAVARAHNLRYTDLSQGPIRACKLSDTNHTILFFADLRTILIDGASRLLPYPVRWNGAALLVPREGAKAVAESLGKHPEISYTVLKPRRPAQTRPTRTRPFTVVIDPGHGGRDPGAVYANLQEKTVNLDIAKRIRLHLKANGVTVVLTRDRDIFLSLDQRIHIAKRARPDLFVSIHANAETSRRNVGAMTLYPPKGRRQAKPAIDDRARIEVIRKAIQPTVFGAEGPVGQRAMVAVTTIAFESYRWMSIEAAHLIQGKLAHIAGTASTNNGVIEDWRGLRVLSTMHAPAVLVEVDFLSNPYRRRKLAQPAYRAAIARCIGEATVAYLAKTAKEQPPK